MLLVCSVGQSYMTLCHTMNCSSRGFSVYGICQARILEWITIFFSWRSSSPRDRTHISCIERQILYNWVNWEALGSQLLLLLSHLVKSNSLQPHGLQHAMPDFPVLHYLPEFAQIHVCWVDDAIKPSHPLSSPSSLALSLSQHQGLFQWVSFSHLVAKVLELKLQHQSFQWIFRIDFL